MDEEKMPRGLSNKIGIGFFVFLVQAVLFSLFKEIGLFFVGGIFFFLFIFSSQNKKLKKLDENKFLKERDWYNSKYNLTKEIP